MKMWLKKLLKFAEGLTKNVFEILMRFETPVSKYPSASGAQRPFNYVH